MHHRPKLEPPLLLSLALLLLPLVHGYPTINQGNPQQNSYVQSLDKMFEQPVQLEDTIQEVQQILARDPSLPRLTRGEIEELYEKVTREEYQKSIAAGDTGRADSMRALMLVLPYNTDNNTEQNLQELYTRPPVTKVIDGYTPPHPIKFITADPSSLPKADTMSVGQLDATTYKPFFALKTAPTLQSPTTYHPPAPPPVMYQMTPSVPASIMQFQPVTNGPLVFDYGTNLERASTPKPAQRFSSHYSAKNTQFLKQPAAQRKPRPTTSTVRPVADVLESLGIVGQTQSRKRFTIDDYYAAESAPQPVVSAYVPQQPQIRADAYTSFKPLNIGEEIRAKPEVEDYLTRFGIVGGRRRKALKKKGSAVEQQSVEEQQSAESEIATAKVPPSSAKPRKGVQGGGATELEKLLENLQELERLNLKAKDTSTTGKTTTTTTPTTARPSSGTRTTTTTTTTNASPSSLNLITNGAPLLVEPKKPRRRIDPHIDINSAAASNKITEQSGGDQLSKLLQNLQELEKLRSSTAAAPKAVTKPLSSTTTTKSTTATPQLLPAHSQTVTNRFNEPLLQLQFQQLQQLQQQQQQQVQRSKPSQQGELQELQRVLKQLQAAEQATARSTTTTKAPSLRPNFGLNDFSQLRKLLTDDRELERLYEQARGKRPGATTPSTTTSTTTTRKPSPSLGELEQLQKYLAAFERNRSVTPPTTTTSSSTTTTTAAPTTTTAAPTTTSSTSTSTSTTTSTTTTTTTTTPRPATASADFSQRIAASAAASPKKPAAVDNAQLQELISRVQQLERQNSRPAAADGFSSRNVNSPQATANDLRVPTNDFAQLQQLYQQVAQAEQASFGRIEISTAATAAKTSSQQQQQQQQQVKAAQRTQHFAQRIIDITNDTGSGSSLQEVDPHDFVQLQKLLRKVQELERVKILPDQLAAAPIYVQPPQAVPAPTQLPSLVTAASFESAQAVPQLIYPEQSRKKPPIKSSVPNYTELDELRLDLPVYQSSSTRKPASVNSNSAPSSSEELRDYVLAKPANPQSAATTDAEFEQYQLFFSHLEDTERNSDQKMQSPTKQKTLPVTKQPPLSIATRKPEELAKPRLPSPNNNNKKQADLAQLQILLNNAQELEKLGITLPQQLSVQIENKLTQSSSSAETGYKKTPLSGNEPATATAKPTKLGTVDRVAAAEVQQYLNGDDLLDSGEQKLSSTTTKAESTSVESAEELSERTVVFSVTTMKSLTPKTPRPTSDSTLELPIISYNKVIEAAVRQAASKFGFSTEQTLGFRRRSDDDVEDMATDDADLMGEFSEINYQLAQPDASLELAESAAEAAITEASIATNATTTAAAAPADELSELQRLIGNLQELQRLNLNASPELLRKADAKYLESFKRPDGSVTDDDTKKSRRQSATPSMSTVTAAPSTESSTQEAESVNAAVEPSTESDVAAALPAAVESDVAAALPAAVESDVAAALPAAVESDIAATLPAAVESDVAAVLPAAVESESTTAAPTRINLDLSLANSDADVDAAPVSEASSTSSASSTEDSATEEPRNGSLADLEASFGPNPNTETPPPPKKKNGFYFLADWNSFLEVGDGDDQVVVRFSPKIGDPRLFIPVKIP